MHAELPIRTFPLLKVECKAVLSLLEQHIVLAIGLTSHVRKHLYFLIREPCI